MVSLDAEEWAILESVELGEWQSVPNVAQEIERYQHYAQTQAAVEAVSLSLPTRDLQVLQALAQQSGISVSLLMATVLHQFVASRQHEQG
ncbi:MAG: hypothetical protein WBA10_05945 [Elainellaceae cyanobacterium]